MRGTWAWIIALSCALACAFPGTPPASEQASTPVEPTLGGMESGVGGGDAVPPTAHSGESVERLTPAPHGDGASTGPVATDALIFERGEGELALWIPRDEALTFRVILELGPLGDIDAGQVVLSSGVERYVSGLPSRGAAVPKTGDLETGWIRSNATGSYAGYRLDHELRARLLPQIWPRVFYTDAQRGTESRRRELKIGLQDGGLIASLRSDQHCKGCGNSEHFVESKWVWGKPYHCEKCKLAAHRVWKEPVERPLPPGCVDMLSAVYLARSLMRDGRTTTEFTMIDKQRLWRVHLARGKHRRVTTPAGSFDAQEVKLSTSVPSGEPSPSNGFEGLFGIRGTLQIWLESRTGVPVLIQGELPVPVLGALDVRVELESSRGTSRGFSPSR